MQTLHVQLQRLKIDAEILELRSRILTLSSQRNDLSPIGHLPPEVLSRIFLYFRACSELEHSSEFLTWICRDWRYVAIGCAQLWSEIDFYNPHAVKLYLGRSKNAPLKLHLLHLTPGRIPTSVLLMLRHLSRAEALRVCREENQPPGNMVRLGTALCLPTPLLRILLLDGVKLHPGIFGGQTPSLTTAAITSCEIPWKRMPQTLSNLTVFAMVTPVNRAALTDFLDMLRHAPNLTRLEMQDVFEGSYKLPEHIPQGPVVLSRLKELGVPMENCAVMGQFLRHLSLTHTPELKINITTAPQNVTEFMTFIQLYCTSIFSSKAIPRLALGYGTDYAMFRVFTHFSDDPDETAPFHLGLVRDSYPQQNLSALSSAHLNLDSLQYLTLTSAKDYPIQWVPIFGSLPHLRILEIRGFAARSFADLLVEESETVGTAYRNLFTRYLDDIGVARPNTSPITADPDAQALLTKAGLSFRALENLRLVLPHPVHDSRAFPMAYDELLIFNLFCRRLCGIGLKKFTHMNWRKQTGPVMVMACRVVDDMQKNSNMEVEWFKP